MQWDTGGTMSRLIRTVSLDRLSDELAGNKPNFSKWVRDSLKHDNLQRTHIHATLSIFKERGICNPSASPRCGLCFPLCRPPASAIRKYNSGIGARTDGEQGLAIGELLVATEEFHEKLDPVDSKKQEKEPLPPVLRERKYLRRAVKWVINFI
jgi:hypothetical protein|tara:strand:+ start:1604 stop:2062 length:459 start_codon:yes stop_codon:yes gene_type:complete